LGFEFANGREGERLSEKERKGEGGRKQLG